MRPLAPAWPWSSWIMSREPREVHPALISPLLGSQPSEAAPTEVLVSLASRGLAPREGLELLLLKLGRTGPLMEPRHGSQAGKSGHPRSQDADRTLWVRSTRSHRFVIDLNFQNLSVHFALIDSSISVISSSLSWSIFQSQCNRLELFGHTELQ